MKISGSSIFKIVGYFKSKISGRAMLPVTKQGRLLENTNAEDLPHTPLSHPPLRKYLKLKNFSFENNYFLS